MFAIVLSLINTGGLVFLFWRVFRPTKVLAIPVPAASVPAAPVSPLAEGVLSPNRAICSKCERLVTRWKIVDGKPICPRHWAGITPSATN